MVRGRAWAWGVLVGFVGACGGGGGDRIGEVVAERVATTTTTTTVGTTTSTTSTTSVPATTVPPGPEYHEVGASGAGCTPGDVTELPDGWWAGEIVAVTGDRADFDLVCFFAGAAGATAAAEDGVEFTNDYHVRNDNPRTFTVTFPDPGGPATCIASDARPFPCTIGDVLELYPGAGHTGVVDGREVIAFPIVWLHIAGGTPDHVTVQYTP